MTEAIWPTELLIFTLWLYMRRPLDSTVSKESSIQIAQCRLLEPGTPDTRMTIYTVGISNNGPRPSISSISTTQKLARMHITRPHPRPPESEVIGVDSLCFNKLSTSRMGTMAQHHSPSSHPCIENVKIVLLFKKKKKKKADQNDAYKKGGIFQGCDPMFLN